MQVVEGCVLTGVAVAERNAPRSPVRRCSSTNCAKLSRSGKLRSNSSQRFGHRDLERRTDRRDDCAFRDRPDRARPALSRRPPARRSPGRENRDRRAGGRRNVDRVRRHVGASSAIAPFVSPASNAGACGCDGRSRRRRRAAAAGRNGHARGSKPSSSVREKQAAQRVPRSHGRLRLVYRQKSPRGTGRGSRTCPNPPIHNLSGEL